MGASRYKRKFTDAELLEHRRKSIAKARERRWKGHPFQYGQVLTTIRDKTIAGDVPWSTFAQIGDLRKGTREQIRVLTNTHRERIKDWLAREWPLDHWSVHTIHVPDHWKDKEIWVEFHGIAETPAQLETWKRAMPKRTIEDRKKWLLESTRPGRR